MPADQFDLIVVGMGSAGTVAAELAATIGLRVCAIERDRIGGDCLWTGCVPSKALLASARAAHAMRTADRLGLEAVEPRIDTARVLAHVRDVQGRIAATDDDPGRFRAMGVDVRLGEAGVLAGERAVRAGGETIRGRHVLLCPGSRPAVPPIDGLEAAGYLTSESIWEIERAPRSLVVLGGGPIAVEIAQGFRRLGVEVTLLEQAPAILGREEPELAGRVAARLAREGVEIHTGVRADRVTAGEGRKTIEAGERRFAAEEIVVATGRRANVEGLGLEAVGLAPSAEGTLEVDDRSRTALPWLYAVGDVTGGHQFTHAAASAAASAVRDLAFPGRGRRAGLVPWCTFTDPELAHAGLTAAQARERHGTRAVRTHRIELARSDRARADRDADDDGALLAVTHRGRLVGAHVLAPNAGELIGELALAIDQRLKLSDLASVVHVYPTYSTSIAQLAAEPAFARARRLHRLLGLSRRRPWSAS